MDAHSTLNESGLHATQLLTPRQGVLRGFRESNVADPGCIAGRIVPCIQQICCTQCNPGDCGTALPTPTAAVTTTPPPGINTNGGADRSGWCPRAERFSCFGMYGEWAIRERVVGVLGKSGKEIENRRL